MRWPDARQTIATPKDRAALLNHAPAWLRWHLLLASDLALRFREAASATLSGYDTASGILTVTAKGGYLQRLPVTEEIRRVIQSLPPDADPSTPIIHLIYGRSISPNTIRDAWLRLKRRLGINPDLRIHDLRRTTATLAYNATKDIRVVQQILGHRTLRSTTHYLVDRHPQDLRPLLEQLKVPTEVKQ